MMGNGMDKKIPIEKKVLSKNDELAAEIRRIMNDRKICLFATRRTNPPITIMIDKTLSTTCCATFVSIHLTY